MNKLKVAVFDDNKARLDGLRLLLEAMEDMECVGTFEDCRNVVDHVRKTQPDVVLMDIDMPFVDGIEGLQKIKIEFPKLKVIMQTVFEEEDKIIAAICAGADGYILKQKSPMQLIEGITEVMNGGAPMTPSVARKVLKMFSKSQKKDKAIKPDLTEREVEILKLLIEGYSYKMIAAKCFVTYATVNTHVSHIYKKLHVQSVAAAVSKAIREKLV